MSEIAVNDQNKDLIPYPVSTLTVGKSKAYWYSDPSESKQKGYNQHHFPALKRIIDYIEAHPNGGIIGICGPMGSGKTALLLLLSSVKKLRIQAFTHQKDMQRTSDKAVIKSWGSGKEYPAQVYKDLSDLETYLHDVKPGTVVLIDEWHFCDRAKVDASEFRSLIKIINEKRITLVIAGLDFSYKRIQWENNRALFGHADLMLVLSARCSEPQCQNPAIFTQLNLDDKPASFNSDALMLVGKVSYNYFPKCEKHHFSSINGLHHVAQKKINKKGLLISFEGGEGAGKTVQIKLLADLLIKTGKEVLITREPGGTAISEQIREIVLHTKNTGMAFGTEVLLFQAARAQIYQELIIPALETGKVVLCDRTRDSSVVYQGIVRGFGEDLIEQLNNISTQNLYPDLTMLLDIKSELGLARRSASEVMNRLDLEQKDFHDKVRAGYLKLAKRNDHGRWIVVDASKTIEEVHQQIIKQIKQKGLL